MSSKSSMRKAFHWPVVLLGAEEILRRMDLMEESGYGVGMPLKATLGGLFLILSLLARSHEIDSFSPLCSLQNVACCPRPRATELSSHGLKPIQP